MFVKVLIFLHFRKYDPCDKICCLGTIITEIMVCYICASVLYSLLFLSLGEEERKRRMGRSGQAKDKKKITEMEEGEGGGGESSQNVSVEEVPSIPNTPLIATSTIAAPSVEPANDTETPTQVPPATATQVFNTPPAPPIQITLQIPPGSTESVNLLSLSR